MTEPGRAHVHDARVDLVDTLPGEPPARKHFTAEVLDDRVRDADEPFGQREPLGVTRVQADGQLAVVQDREVRGVVVGLLAVGVAAAVQRPRPLLRRERLLRATDDRTRVRRVAMIIPGPDALDVDDLGAEVREQPRCPWPDGLPREIEDAYSVEDASRERD